MLFEDDLKSLGTDTETTSCLRILNSETVPNFSQSNSRVSSAYKGYIMYGAQQWALRNSTGKSESVLFISTEYLRVCHSSDTISLLFYQ